MPTMLLYLKGRRVHEEPLDFAGMFSHNQRQMHIEQTARRIMDQYEKDLMLCAWELVILGSRSRCSEIMVHHTSSMTDRAFIEEMKKEIHYLKRA